MRRRGRPPYPDILTPREWEVLALLREGLSNEEIAQHLEFTLAGAKYHVSEILGKLGVTTREEAAAWQPTQRPRWLAAAAPAAFLWRRASLGWLPGIAAGVAVTAVVAAGVGLLVWGLLRTGGEGGGRPPVPSLAYAAPDDTIWMVSADGANNVQLVGEAVGAHNSAWSPTGRFMAHEGSDGSFWVLDVETGRDTVLDDATTDSVMLRIDPFVRLIRWSPVADAMLYQKFAKESAISPRPVSFGMWAATPGGAPIAVAQRPDLLRSAWSPDGSRIVYEVRSADAATPAAIRTNQLFLVNADGSNTHRLTDGILLSDPWSPDGRLLAYWKSDRGGSSTIGDIYVMDVDSGREFSLGEFTSDERPQWSHHRNRHVFYNLAIDPDAQSAVGLFDRPSVILRWSPDGNKVAYVEGAAFGPPPRSLVVLDVESGNSTTFHTSNADTPHAAGSGYSGGWSPDSRYYAFAALESVPDGTYSSALYVADTQSGEANQILGGVDIVELFVSFSPDGSRLLIQHGYLQSPEIWIARPDGSQASKIVDGVALQAGDNPRGWRPAIE